MSEWVTDSRVRLRFRRVIRAEVDRWVHGPVELLACEDKRALRSVLRRVWNRRDRRKRGYRYLAWLAEVHLALDLPGDALKSIRAKVQRKAIVRGAVMPGAVEWLDGQEMARVVELPRQREGFGELFEQKSF